jgi:capsule polysaccharide export protein KpsE/RkpR
MIPAPTRKLGPAVAIMDPPAGVVPDDANGVGGADGAAELGRLMSIFHSRSLTDDTIRHFGLDAVYHHKSMEDARDQFWNRLATSQLQAKEGFVEMTVEDRSSQRAAAIANYMAAQANEVMRRISTSAASQERAFLEHRLDEVRLELAQSEEQFTRFQRKNKLINLDEQSHAVLTTMLGLKERLVNQELELRRLSGFASPTEPAAVRSAHEIKDLRQKLDELQRPDEGNADVFTRLDAIPDLRLKGERLLRDLKTKTSVYELLVREYEVAKLTEVRDTQSYEILDAAVVPTKKSRPSRTWAVIGFALFGFGMAFCGGAAAGAWPVLKRYRA